MYRLDPKVLSVRNASKVVSVFRLSMFYVFNHKSYGCAHFQVYATSYKLRCKHISQNSQKKHHFLEHRNEIASTTQNSFEWKVVNTQYVHA